MKILQELTEDDFDKRVEFFEIITTAINGNTSHVKNICFADDCIFSLKGFVIKHNAGNGAMNAHTFVEGHT